MRARPPPAAFIATLNVLGANSTMIDLLIFLCLPPPGRNPL